MTWHENLAEANWIQLGYLAANTSSLLLPILKGREIDLSLDDREVLRQQADFFDAAVNGWASFDEPSLLFQRPEDSFVRPAGALETAAEIYSTVHGGPLGNPEQFKAELQTFRDILRRIAKGNKLKSGELATARNLSSFLEALINRARSAIHKSARASR